MQSSNTKKPVNPIRKWGALVAIAALLMIGYWLGVFEHFGLSSFIENRQALGDFVEANFVLASLAFILVYASLVAISFPGASFLTIASGFFFGGILGGSFAVIGATIGAVIIFTIARSSFGEFLKEKAGPFVNKMVEGFKRDSFQYLLTLRLVPVFPFWVLNIVPALLDMKVKPYALATFLGIIPGTFTYAYIGTGMDSIIADVAEKQPGCAEAGTCELDFGSLVTPEILIAISMLGVISILPLAIKKLRGGKPISGVK
jgi:uncharacterized membrane protein YdjX (TVP38/TMEM64 family)